MDTTIREYLETERRTLIQRLRNVERLLGMPSSLRKQADKHKCLTESQEYIELFVEESKWVQGRKKQ